MWKPMRNCALACAMSILSACATTTPSVETICLAIAADDVLPVLTDKEKRLIREEFSRRAKDVLKTPAAQKRALGC